MTRSGRRPGDPGTRDQILSAARELFAAGGFDRTSVRGVARAAAVDPALVLHYFGDKDGLFMACLDVELETGLVERALTGGRRGLGARVTRMYLGVWESPVTGGVARSVLRSATTHPAAAAALRDLITRRILDPVAHHVASDHPRRRAALAGSHLVGVAMARYVLEVDVLAELSQDEVVAAVAPAVQRYLTGRIDWAATPAAPRSLSPGSAGSTSAG